MKKRLIILLSIAFSTLSLNVKAEVTFPDAAFSNLDYGLYWFDYNDAKKANVNEPNPYYNANNKTVIYIHGWQNAPKSSLKIIIEPSLSPLPIESDASLNKLSMCSITSSSALSHA